MSQVIELKDEVFTKLKQKAENDGVTPEVWIEIKIKESSNGEEQNLKISGDERKTLNEFHKRMEEKFDEMMSEKARKEGLKI